MDDEPEVIRQQMEDTRSSLTNKIERLEHTVEQKVQSTTAAVSCTVESVKEAVEETVQSVKGTVSDTVDTVRDTVTSTVENVKEAFDVRGYFQEYPWAAFGAAFGVGFAGGTLLGHGGRARGDRIPDLHSRGEAPTFSTAAPSHNGGTREPIRPGAFTSSSAPAAPGIASDMATKFGDELGKLKGVALGTLFGLVRDWISRSAPPAVGTKVGEVIDDFTRKMGGEPIRDNLLDSFTRVVGGKASQERDTSGSARREYRTPSL